MTSDLEQRVLDLVQPHPAVRSVKLVGSRAEGRATERSDWDFCLETDQFEQLARTLPELLAPLGPLAQQWDRLATHRCRMLMLPGPAKVDLVFPDEAHEPEPPWLPTADNLAAIDRHFWDWTLWLTSKEAAGRNDRVAAELKRLSDHLLAPLGAQTAPASIADAIDVYRSSPRTGRKPLRGPGLSSPRRRDRGLAHRLASCVDSIIGNRRRVLLVSSVVVLAAFGTQGSSARAALRPRLQC